MQLSADTTEHVGSAPDLKTIVPYVRRKVLKGARLVFSGVCPLESDPTTCRIYRVAESLGAIVQSSLTSGESESTTHVVAARPGTEKVKAALRQKNVLVVNPDWLWTCADRWEWVDERLYPLNDETSARFLSRDSPDPTTGLRSRYSSPSLRKLGVGTSKLTSNDDDPGVDYSLVTLSKEDISGMDAEVERILDDEADSESDEADSESVDHTTKNPPACDSAADGDDDAVLRKQVLSSYCGRKREYESSSDDESLSGDFPKGWKNSETKRRRVSDNAQKLVGVGESGDCNDDDIDGDYDKYGANFDDSRDGSSSGSASGNEDFAESIGSVDEEIAAAVEKEFLS